MNIVIERATSDDASELLSYLRSVGSETDNLSFGGEGLPITVEAEERYLNRIYNSVDDMMLLAKENGRIVGCATLSRLPRRMNHRGDFSISVLKEYWNRGIGNRLLCEILALAKQYSFEVIELQVRSDNLSAIHLYEKYGFIKIGTHPAFFKIGNDEIPVDYMVLKIK